MTNYQIGDIVNILGTGDNYSITKIQTEPQLSCTYNAQGNGACTIVGYAQTDFTLSNGQSVKADQIQLVQTIYTEATAVNTIEEQSAAFIGTTYDGGYSANLQAPPNYYFTSGSTTGYNEQSPYTQLSMAGISGILPFILIGLAFFFFMKRR